MTPDGVRFGGKLQTARECGINFDSFLLYVKHSISWDLYTQMQFGLRNGIILGRKYAPEEKPLSGLAFFINFCFLAGRGGGGVLDVFWICFLSELLINASKTFSPWFLSLPFTPPAIECGASFDVVTKLLLDPVALNCPEKTVLFCAPLVMVEKHQTDKLYSNQLCKVFGQWLGRKLCTQRIHEFAIPGPPVSKITSSM